LSGVRTNTDLSVPALAAGTNAEFSECGWRVPRSRICQVKLYTPEPQEHKVTYDETATPWTLWVTARDGTAYKYAWFLLFTPN